MARGDCDTKTIWTAQTGPLFAQTSHSFPKTENYEALPPEIRKLENVRLKRIQLYIPW